MSKNTSTDKRLLEALEYVDEKYLAEITDTYEVIDLPGEYKPDKRGQRRAYFRAAVAVICLLAAAALLSSAPAILQRVGIIPGFNPPHGTDDQTDRQTEPEETGEGIYENYVLTQKELDGLNAAYEKYNRRKFAETVEEACAKKEYRGKFGDCIIIRENGDADAIYETILGDYSFFSPTIPAYYACYGAELYNLLEVYLLGYMSDTDVKALSECHNRIEGGGSSYSPERDRLCGESVPISLEYEQIRDIVRATYKKKFKMYRETSDYGIPSENNTGYHYVRCFAKFGDAYAVVVNGMGRFRDEADQNVNGMLFSAENFGYLYIYKDGSVYDLGEAVEDRIISQGELKELYKIYLENKDLYPSKGSSGDWYGDMRNLDLSSLNVKIMPYADVSSYKAEFFSEIGCTHLEIVDASEGVLRLTFPKRKSEELTKALNMLTRRIDIYSVNYNYIDIISEEDFLAKYVGDGIEYYGKYGNCYVTFTNYGDLIALEEQVGNFTFKYPNGNGIRAFYSDDYIRLPEAYERGLLNDEDIKDIYTYYTEIMAIKVEHTDNISLHEAKKLIYDISWGKPNYKTTYGTDYIYQLVYYGGDGDTHAYRLLNVMALAADRRERINGLNFWFGSSLGVTVFHEGVKYDLRDAFEKNIVSESFLEEIYEACGGDKPIEMFGFKDICVRVSDFYFGEFNGAHVIAYGSGYPAEWKGKETVGKYTFDYDATEYSHILVYANGKFFSLSDAYLLFLSEDDLDRIYFDFDVFNSVRIDDIGPARVYNRRELVRAVIKEKGGYSHGDVFTFECFKNNEEAVALIVDTKKDDKAHYEYVGGRYLFEYADSREIEIFAGGEFYGLKEALDKGIIDGAYLSELHNTYKKAHPELY